MSVFAPSKVTLFECVYICTYIYTNIYAYIHRQLSQGYNYKYSMVRFFFKINHLDGGVIYLHGSTFRVKDLSHTWLAKHVASDVGAFLRQWPWMTFVGSWTECHIQWVTLIVGQALKFAGYFLVPWTLRRWLTSSYKPPWLTLVLYLE